MELCGAVLATGIAESIRNQLKITQSDFQFYTDSQVVLGYISNETKRFYIYVANRVGIIRLFSHPSQWHFVRAKCNPADVATRSIDASQLKDSSWLSGPAENLDITAETGFQLVNPNQDVEIRPEVVSNKHEVDMRESFSTESESTFSDRFLRFSSWNKVVRTIARIIYWARKCKATCTHDRFDDPELLRDNFVCSKRQLQGGVEVHERFQPNST